MVQVRLATTDDAATIARIHREARREAMPYLPHLHSDEDTVAWVREIVLPAQDVWVAVLGERIIGYVAINGETVAGLYVDPCFQRRGVGSALLRLAMDRSGATLDLWTFQRNLHARRFYEAHGFRAVELTDGASNEEREPDVRYRWTRQGDHSPA